MTSLPSFGNQSGVVATQGCHCWQHLSQTLMKHPYRSPGGVRGLGRGINACSGWWLLSDAQARDIRVPGTQLPWKPAGMRTGTWTSATGAASRSAASRTAR